LRSTAYRFSPAASWCPIISDVNAGKLDFAMKGSDAVITKMQAITTAAGAPMTALDAFVAQLPSGGGFDLFGAFQRGATVSELGQIDSAARIQKKLDWWDWVTAIASVIITLVIAYQTLWVSDLTWEVRRRTSQQCCGVPASIS
jgi:hypothetical protein